MRMLLLFTSLILASVGLSGCSAPTISDARYLDVSGSSDYFAQVQEKAVTYFVCGKSMQKNVMFGDIDTTKHFWCSFSVNGRSYEKLNTGVIAKLVLEPGQYTISRPDDPFATIQPVTVDLKPGSTTTFIADFTDTVQFSGREFLQSVRTIDGPVPDTFKARIPVSM